MISGDYLEIQNLLNLIKLFEVSEEEAAIFWKEHCSEIDKMILSNLDFMISQYHDTQSETLKKHIANCLLDCRDYRKTFTIQQCFSLYSEDGDLGDSFTVIAAVYLKPLFSSEVSYLIGLLASHKDEGLAKSVLLPDEKIDFTVKNCMEAQAAYNKNVAQYFKQIAFSMDRAHLEADFEYLISGLTSTRSSISSTCGQLLMKSSNDIVFTLAQCIEAQNVGRKDVRLFFSTLAQNMDLKSIEKQQSYLLTELCNTDNKNVRILVNILLRKSEDSSKQVVDQKQVLLEKLKKVFSQTSNETESLCKE